MSVFDNTPHPFSGDPIGAAAIFAGSAPRYDSTSVVDRLNDLLRGEINAAENYARLIEQVRANTSVEKIEFLQEIKDEHTQHGNLLRSRIAELGGEPTGGSGARGVWSHALHDAVSVVAGNKGGIWAMREGEEHLLDEYSASIDEIDNITAQLVANRLVPAQQKHVTMLGQVYGH